MPIAIYCEDYDTRTRLINTLWQEGETIQNYTEAI
jgi:hypothetical protein